MSSNLIIDNKCIKCGTCLSLKCNFLSERSDGSIAVKDCTFVKEDDDEFKKLCEICPVGAFRIDSSVKVLSKSEQLQEIVKKLKSWTYLKKPTKEDLKFNEKNYTINMPYVGGSGYIYSSESAAERAALNQFNNAMYSKIDVFILQVVSQYRADKLSPYYTYGEDSASVYYKHNNKIMAWLKRAKDLIGNELTGNLVYFNIYPGSDTYYKMLNKGEIMGDEMISGIRREFDSSSYTDLDSYSSYMDFDDMEMYEGTGRFGKTKYSDKYCYRAQIDAARELEKDIRSALSYRDTQIEERAVEITSWLVDEYNKKMKEELSKRIEIINKYI